MTCLMVVGAGGHGRVIADTAEEMGVFSSIAFVDDARCSPGRSGRWPVIGTSDNASEYLDRFTCAAIGVGHNRTRLARLSAFHEAGFELPGIVHPRAWVNATLEQQLGCVVFAGASMGPGVQLGRGVIINTGAVVGHSCRLADGVHLSPGVVLEPRVRVGRCAWVGIGASVVHGIRIGDDAMVGAGALVDADVEDGAVVVGIPAQPIRRTEEEHRS